MNTHSQEPAAAAVAALAAIKNDHMSEKSEMTNAQALLANLGKLITKGLCDGGTEDVRNQIRSEALAAIEVAFAYERQASEIARYKDRDELAKQVVRLGNALYGEDRDLACVDLEPYIGRVDAMRKCWDQTVKELEEELEAVRKHSHHMDRKLAQYEAKIAKDLVALKVAQDMCEILSMFGPPPVVDTGSPADLIAKAIAETPEEVFKPFEDALRRILDGKDNALTDDEVMMLSKLLESVTAPIV